MTYRNKKPGVPAPGFFIVLAVSFSYLSSLAKKSQEIFKFFIKIKKGALINLAAFCILTDVDVVSFIKLFDILRLPLRNIFLKTYLYLPL